MGIQGFEEYPSEMGDDLFALISESTTRPVGAVIFILIPPDDSQGVGMGGVFRCGDDDLPGPHNHGMDPGQIVSVLQQIVGGFARLN